MTWWRMGEGTCLCGWLHHVRAPRGTETPVSCSMEHCGVSWPGSILSSSLPSRMQRRQAWGLSPGTCIGKCHMWASAGCCFARLVQPLSRPSPPCTLCGRATTLHPRHADQPSPSSQA